MSSGGPSGGGGSAAPRQCEGCHAAVGMPFCRVEWSYLCASCGPQVHRNSWIVAVPPFPPPSHSLPRSNASSGNAAANPSSSPFCFPPYVNMTNMNMNMSINLPMQNPLHPNCPSSAGEAVKRRRRRRPRSSCNSKSKEGEMAGPPPTDTDTDTNATTTTNGNRVESVMRYRQKRKIRHPLLPTSAPPPPLPPTAPSTVSDGTETVVAYAELHPTAGVEGSFPITGIRPECTGDEAEAEGETGAMENITFEMEPPPPELEIEAVEEE